jgi:hypothetical protein
MLHANRTLLERLRAASLAAAPEVTWTAAGAKLLDVYRETIAAHAVGMSIKMRKEQELVGVKS